jgi:hypothetical protein
LLICQRGSADLRDACRLLALTCPTRWGEASPLRPRSSDVDLFCYCERVVDLDPKVSHGALDLGVP